MGTAVMSKAEAKSVSSGRERGLITRSQEGEI